MRIYPPEQLEEFIIPPIQPENSHWSLSRKEKGIASALAQSGLSSQAYDNIVRDSHSNSRSHIEYDQFCVFFMLFLCFFYVFFMFLRFLMVVFICLMCLGNIWPIPTSKWKKNVLNAKIQKKYTKIARKWLENVWFHIWISSENPL